MTLRARIAAVAGLAVAIAVVATAVFTYLAVRSSLRGEVDDSLTARADGVTRGPGPPGGRPGPPPGPPPRAGPRPGPPPGLELRPDDSTASFGGARGYAQFVSADGAVTRPPGASGPSLPVDSRARELAQGGDGSYLTDTDVDGTHLRVLTQAVPGGAVQVARPLDEIDSQLSRILLALVVVGGVGIALGVALGAAVARAALVPITRFTDRTEQLSADLNLSERMQVDGDDELARLARSFNTTLGALEQSVEAQRHLVADASHELRTPIASLRANIQTLEDAERLPGDERERMREDILEELDELTRLVGDVVELARGAKRGEAPDDVRLDRVVADLVERAERRAKDEELEFRLALEPTVVRGESERVARAVSNLLGNAAKWSPLGGVVEIALNDGVLSIRDHGPGFSAEDLPHVFERFYRAAGARGMSGSGLGLAIVQQAAEAHGGFVEAANAPGGGALMRVSFGEPLTLSAVDSHARSAPSSNG